MREEKYDQLKVKIYDSRREMGQAAAADVAAAIEQVLAEKEECNMIFAAAPSQNEMLEALRDNQNIPWERVRAFHMDEYCGLDPKASQCFGNFLDRALFAQVNMRARYYLRDAGKTPEEICRNYSDLLRQYPVDIVCLGIGENGHIAFNDPPVADFKDEELVKLVKLDEVCRMQQVHDGCFASIDQVPVCAVTLTIPALCAARYMFCVVPAATKARAVRAACTGPVKESCPASVLRCHPGAVLYLDPDSSSLLE